MRLIYFEIATHKFGRASLIISKILLTPSAPRKDTNPFPDLGKRFGIFEVSNWLSLRHMVYTERKVCSNLTERKVIVALRKLSQTLASLHAALDIISYRTQE